MTSIAPDLQAELNSLYFSEQNAVGQMLLLAVQHGFCLTELTRLAEKYQINAAWLEKHDNGYYISYANGYGFFHRHFSYEESDADSFLKLFIFHNTLPK